MTKEVAKAIGCTIGVVEQFGNPEEDLSYGNYLRARVCINISKLLCRGRKFKLGGGCDWRVSFKYERLPNFCHWRGLLTQVRMIVNTDSNINNHSKRRINSIVSLKVSMPI